MVFRVNLSAQYQALTKCKNPECNFKSSSIFEEIKTKEVRFKKTFYTGF